MKMKLLALALGLFAVGAPLAASAMNKCVPIKCTIDPVTKMKRCTLLCSGGSLQL